MEERKTSVLALAEAPVCSICIANFNGVGVIQECINSIKAQDTDICYEIIVHDDASTDDSVNLIRHQYPEVRLLVSHENVGFCISNNRMAAVARGKYILLLNNDAALFPDALRTLHHYAISQPNPAILGLPQYDAETGALLDIGSVSDIFLNPIPNRDPERIEVAMVIGACLWVPMNLWHKIGGFPEWFHTLAEDMYLCCVARLWGFPVIAIPYSGFRHWMGASLGGGKPKCNRLSTSMRRRTLSERNKTFVLILCCPTLLLLIVLPLHLALLIVEGIAISIIKRNFSLWREIYAPLIPSLWKARKQLFTSREIIQNNRNSGWKSWKHVVRPWPHKISLLMKYGIPEIQ